MNSISMDAVQIYHADTVIIIILLIFIEDDKWNKTLVDCVNASIALFVG